MYGGRFLVRYISWWCFVITTAHQSLAVGTKINASDTMMHLEGVDFLAFFYIPEFDSTVPTTAHQSLAVGTKINASDKAIMLLEGVDFFACFYIPEYDSFSKFWLVTLQ